MKRYPSLFGLILLGLASCVQETYPDVPVDRMEVRLCGAIDDGSSTRADEKGFYDGDAFGVYISSFHNLSPSGNMADNVRFVYDAASASWMPDHPVYFTDPDQNVSIMAYYPFKDDLEDPSAFPFEVSRDQRKPAANGLLGGYEASDFLYASKTDVKPTPDVISLLFKHRLANLKVTLLEGTGWDDDEWSRVSKDVLVTGTIRQSVIDLADGSVRTEGSDRSLGIVPMALVNDIWRAVVIPQETPAGTAILSITIDGQSREYTPDGAYRYYDGKQNSLTLSVNKTPGYQGIDLELVSEGITPWEDDSTIREESAKDYLVIQCPAGGKLKETILAGGYLPESIKNLKIEGNINQDDFYFMRDELPILQAVNLMEVRIVGNNADSIPSEAFYGKSSLMRVVFPKRLSRICYYAFAETSVRGDLIIPEGVTVIDQAAFRGARINGTVSFPSTLREIWDAAFCESSLRGDLYFPEGLEVIGTRAFAETDVTSVTFPSSLTTLGIQAFATCNRLKGDITIPSGIKNITNTFINCPNLDGHIFLSEGLEVIGDITFGYSPCSGALVIPSTVTSIGEMAFIENTFTSISLPESLQNLGKYAFSTNGRTATGEGFGLKVPDGVTNIPQCCFWGLNITDLVIGKNVEYMGQAAFADCVNISSIVCEALQPPTLEEGVFDGVPKDNFALEVPESAVGDYQNAPGWSEFKRIVAHRDFSISRRLFRTLNKAETRSFVLRAESGASWTVASKPDWVTVSPMSGKGKKEVTVSVSALAKGAGNREGEIVYRLNGKDYSVSTKVEQYDCQYGDGDVYAVQSHRKGRGIQLVFMGDCYDAKDISEGKYLDNTLEAVEHFFAIEPYNTYRDYFDVHVVFGCSEDSGIGDVNTIREARFGSQYLLKEGVKFDEYTCFAYAAKVHSSAALSGICLILNSDLDEGVTYLYDNDLFISLCPVSNKPYPNDFRGVLQHEAGGHGFGKLGDEWIIHPDFIQSCLCLCCPHVSEFNMGKARGWYDNLSLTGDMKKVPWSHLIYDAKYSDLVDVYEGGFYHARGVFRSEANSCMRNKIPYYSTISRESIVRRIMRYAGERYSFAAFKDKDVTDAFTGTRASGKDGEVSDQGVGRHREPVLKGASPNIDTTR